MNFIQSIKAGEPTPEAHKNLLRFGRGEFAREQITIRKTKKQIDAAAGFEYYLTLFRIYIELAKTDEISVKGVIIGPKQQMSQALDELNIQPAKVFGKKFTIDYVTSREELERLADRIEKTSGHLLLTLKSDFGTLTAKTTFPKPGKLVEKFCRLKIPVEHAKIVCEAFMIEEPKKKAVIETTYDITDIRFDEELLESDPARARLESKRDVEVKRSIDIDGETTSESFSSVV